MKAVSYGKLWAVLAAVILFVIFFLWELFSFSLSPSVCGVPSQEKAIPEGEVSLVAVQLNPTRQLPVTFEAVSVTDSVTGEACSPTLFLYNQENVNVLMNTYQGPLSDVSDTFPQAPLLPVAETRLTSKNIVLGSFWTELPTAAHPISYVFQYRILGFFPKTETLTYHWDTNDNVATSFLPGPIALAQKAMIAFTNLL